MKSIDDVVHRDLAAVALAVAGLLFSANAIAQDIAVRNVWARATAPGQNTASIYLEIVSNADAALVGVTSPLAKSAQMHTMRTEGGVMKMRAVQRIELPARKSVMLAPGGLHIMLEGIGRPLREKDKIPIELVIEGAGGGKSAVKTEADVRPITTTNMPHSH
jgi:periplasmic copper chaperone A